MSDETHIRQLLKDKREAVEALIGEGRCEEALHIAREAVETARSHLAGDTPDLAEALSNLGVRQDAAGRSDETLPHHEAAVAMYQRVFPEGHGDLAIALSKLAYCLQALGRFAEALPRHEGALARLLGRPRYCEECGSRAEG